MVAASSIGLLYCYLISWHVSAVQNTPDVAYDYTYVKYIGNSIHIHNIIPTLLKVCSQGVYTFGMVSYVCMCVCGIRKECL